MPRFGLEVVGITPELAAKPFPRRISRDFELVQMHEVGKPGRRLVRQTPHSHSKAAGEIEYTNRNRSSERPALLSRVLDREIAYHLGSSHLGELDLNTTQEEPAYEGPTSHSDESIDWSIRAALSTIRFD